jgi:hypothetical protein
LKHVSSQLWLWQFQLHAMYLPTADVAPPRHVMHAALGASLVVVVVVVVVGLVVVVPASAVDELLTPQGDAHVLSVEVQLVSALQPLSFRHDVSHAASLQADAHFTKLTAFAFAERHD